jgi:hypothetical protein
MKLFAQHQNLQTKIFPKASNKNKSEGGTGKNSIKKNQNIYNVNEQQEFKLANQAHIAMNYNPSH